MLFGRPTANTMYSNETLLLFHMGFLETYIIRFPDDILLKPLKELIHKGNKRNNG